MSCHGVCLSSLLEVSGFPASAEDCTGCLRRHAAARVAVDKSRQKKVSLFCDINELRAFEWGSPRARAINGASYCASWHITTRIDLPCGLVMLHPLSLRAAPAVSLAAFAALPKSANVNSIVRPSLASAATTNSPAGSSATDFIVSVRLTPSTNSCLASRLVILATCVNSSAGVYSDFATGAAADGVGVGGTTGAVDAGGGSATFARGGFSASLEHATVVSTARSAIALVMLIEINQRSNLSHRK